VVAGAGAAAAHPLGNLSVNTYDGVVAGTSRVAVDHVEDLAEIPALAVVRRGDADRSGALDAAERDAVARARCADAAGRVTLSRDGARLPLAVDRAAASVAAGASGLPLLRVECALSAPAAVATGGTGFELAVRPVADVGWREVTATGDRTTVRGDVPSRSVSARLTAYPPALIQSPRCGIEPGPNATSTNG